MVNIESILWWAFLLDSVGANIMAWFFPGWYKKEFKGFWKHFPTTKRWSIFYLALILWVGIGLYRLGILPY
jgi:hypothetical protein